MTYKFYFNEEDITPEYADNRALIPNINDRIKIDNSVYKVVDILIDYDENITYFYLDK